MAKINFLDLGMQPIANNFLSSEDQKVSEYKFHLTVEFDEETKLVSLCDFVPPEMMFNEEYVYHASMSQTMRNHFETIALALTDEFKPKTVMEIGSNDGVFINNFPTNSTIAVEPCGNFARLTSEMGYFTYAEFWNSDLAKKINIDKGKQDLIFSANCMCHIQNLDEAFDSISKILSSSGVFIFEDPSLLKMIERGSYDQIYDEHAHIFSVTALNNILLSKGIEIFRVQEMTVHGGSNRIYSCLAGSRRIEKSVYDHLEKERDSGLDNLSTYHLFSSRVHQSRDQLINLLIELKRQGKKIISYGATSKSTTVFNYCGITSELIDYIVDTTPSKQGKFSPGVHIPVISPEEGLDKNVDYAFLGAWNFENEILSKEKDFTVNNRFITHVPYVRFIK